MAEKVTTWQVLRNKFPAAEYVLLCEVPDTLGHGGGGSIDFMIINLWQSRGLSITGIERKSNRGDWLKEIKNPAKQEAHFIHCDYFYLITDKEKVAKLEEIPPTWGWYHVNERGVLKLMKEAPKLIPKPVHRGLLCAMLRRAADKKGWTHEDDMDSTIEENVRNRMIAIDNEAQRNAESLRILRENIKFFEEHSGVNISGYSHDLDNIGSAVKIIVNDGVEDYKRKLERIVNQVKMTYDDMVLKLEALNKIK